MVKPQKEASHSGKKRYKRYAISQMDTLENGGWHIRREFLQCS